MLTLRPRSVCQPAHDVFVPDSMPPHYIHRPTHYATRHRLAAQSKFVRNQHQSTKHLRTRNTKREVDPTVWGIQRVRYLWSPARSQRAAGSSGLAQRLALQHDATRRSRDVRADSRSRATSALRTPVCGTSPRLWSVGCDRRAGDGERAAPLGGGAHIAHMC